MEVEHGPLEDDCPAETEACFSHFHVKSISLVRVYLSGFGESGPGLLLMDSGRSRGGSEFRSHRHSVQSTWSTLRRSWRASEIPRVGG